VWFSSGPYRTVSAVSAVFLPVIKRSVYADGLEELGIDTQLLAQMWDRNLLLLQSLRWSADRELVNYITWLLWKTEWKKCGGRGIVAYFTLLSLYFAGGTDENHRHISKINVPSPSHGWQPVDHCKTLICLRIHCITFVSRLRVGHSGFDSRQRQWWHLFSPRHRVQTGSGAHPVSCIISTGIKRPDREADHTSI